MAVIISHLYKNPNNGEWVIQSNEEHSFGVATRASGFARDFGMSSWGRILGILHDKGKESAAFQQHIKKASGFAPEIKVKGNYHHAYIGGYIARILYGKSADIFIVNQLVSHHSGLHDTDELNNCLEQAIPPEIDQYVQKIQLSRPPFKLEANDFHHLARMLFSCLVDADYLDTEAFMDRESSELRGHHSSLLSLLSKLEKHLNALKECAEDTPVNQVRRQVQEESLKKSASPVGFYSLTVPTGGGKTLSSLLWAMRHAIHNGQKRIVIAIPYTSIIMQTAETLRKIFGSANVLEHHSNFVMKQEDAKKTINEEDEEENYNALSERLRLATENWDYPIIVTTNVQLFESMFSNKPSKCRKLHNLVNSVIILDEVQTLPTDYLKPIVDSLKSYNKLFKTSILFTTASQPVLSGPIEGCNQKASFEGIAKVTEIIPKELKLHDKLRRVKLEIDNEGKTYDEVAQMLCRHKRVLCIVNSRKDARELYKRLPQEGITLHLSKMMCPAHIAQTIEQMKTALKDDSYEIIRVVSTQLVEAGVDIDFPVVYRQEAGLDSILQAAGRCNREGKNGVCTTYVFSLSKVHLLPVGEISDANEARLGMTGVSDWFAPATMTEYFRQLYCRKESFDEKGMKKYLYHPKDKIAFATAAKKFQLIENKGKDVIVCWANSMDLVQELLQKGPSYRLMKNLSHYCVNIYKEDFESLQQMGEVKEIYEGIYVVEYKTQYDEHIGLRTDNNWANSSLIV